MRLAMIIGALALLSACGSSEERGKVDTGVKADATSAATISITASPTIVASAKFIVGEAVKTDAGNTVTVHTYEAPVTSGLDQYSVPKSGMMYAAADVELCAGANPKSGSAGANPYNFELQMPDNTRAQPSFGERKPALHDTQLVANDCVRGWVTFILPIGAKPTSVNFKGTSLVKWVVP